MLTLGAVPMVSAPKKSEPVMLERSISNNCKRKEIFSGKALNNTSHYVSE